MELKPFQRIPPPLSDEPPLRVTTKDIGKKIGEEGVPDNLEILAKSIPEGCTIEEASEMAEEILAAALNQNDM